MEEPFRIPPGSELPADPPPLDAQASTFRPAPTLKRAGNHNRLWTQLLPGWALDTRGHLLLAVAIRKRAGYVRRMLPEKIIRGGAPFTLRWLLPKIWTQPNGRPFGVYWCRERDHGLLHPEPTESELAAFYDFSAYDTYLSGDQPSTSGTTHRLADRLALKLAHIVDRGQSDPMPTLLRHTDLAGATLCDIGCGGGAFLRHALALGGWPTGIDPSPVSAAAIRAAGIEFHLGTGEAIPLPLSGRQFDVVTMFQSLEHCRDAELALRNVAALLRPGGLFVGDVPNMGCIGAQTYKQAWFHTDAGRHLQFFTTQSFQAMCRSAGLHVVSVEYSGFTHQFAPGWIAEMTRVHSALFGNTRGAPSPSRSRRYLLRALLSPPSGKYEIVRLFALKA